MLESSIETQQTVLYYGTHERGFEHFIVIRPNEWHASYVSSGKFMRKLTYDPRSEKIPDETHQADLELQGRIHDKFEALNRYEKIAFTYDNVVARKQFYVFRSEISKRNDHHSKRKEDYKEMITSAAASAEGRRFRFVRHHVDAGKKNRLSADGTG